MNRPSKRTALLCASIILILLVPSLVSAAVAISGPARSELSVVFKANQTYKWGFVVSGAPAITAHVDGDLVPYAEMRDRAPETGERIITIVIVIPPTTAGGSHNLLFTVANAAEPTDFAYKNITVWVPYRAPNVSLTAFSVADAPVETATTAHLFLQSLTDLDLSVSVEYIVSSADGTVVQKSVSTPQILRGRTVQKRADELSLANLSPGNYSVLALIEYPEGTLNATATFIAQKKAPQQIIVKNWTAPPQTRQETKSGCPYIDCPEECEWRINADDAGCSSCICAPSENPAVAQCANCTMKRAPDVPPVSLWARIKGWFSRLFAN